ncbi:hypothetical protein M1523_02845 [Patescibacteria group bacterium]|nr:hypothetical protein [Patescibacteria group bacterium]
MAGVILNVRPSSSIISPVALTGGVDQTSFSVAQPPLDAVKAKLTSLSGEVAWQSRVATQPARLRSGRVIQQGETLMTGKVGQATVVFPTQGKLALADNAKVEFVQTLPARFVFDQSAGGIDYRNEDKAPWSVKTMRLVTVIGTGETRLAIDPDTGIIAVTVIKGEVRVGYNDRDLNSQVISLQPGERFVFDNDRREGAVE